MSRTKPLLLLLIGLLCCQLQGCQEQVAPELLWEYSAPNRRPSINVVSPSGERVALSNIDTVSVYSTQTGDPVGTPMKWDRIHRAQFLDEETLLLVGPAQLSLRRVEDGKELASFEPGSLIYGYDARPDLVAIGLRDDRVIVLDGQTLKEKWRKKDRTAYHLRFHPKGKLLASSTIEGCKIYQAKSGEHLNTFLPDRYVEYASFSPTGQFLALASVDPRGGGTELDLTLYHTKNWHSMGHAVKQRRYHELSWSKDESRFLVSHETRLSVWASAQPRQMMEMQAPGRLSSFALSPKGDWLLYGTQNGKVALADARSGEAVANLGQGKVTKCLFSSSGKQFQLLRDQRHQAFQNWSLYAQKNSDQRELEALIGSGR